MTENKQNNNDRTDRRPDCVTEIRMGNGNIANTIGNIDR